MTSVCGNVVAYRFPARPGVSAGSVEGVAAGGRPFEVRGGSAAYEQLHGGCPTAVTWLDRCGWTGAIMGEEWGWEELEVEHGVGKGMC